MQAVSVAQSIMARDYVECCAKTRWNVKEVFKSAADAILHKDDKDEGKAPEETKSQSVLRKLSWFTRRSSSGSDINDCNTVARSVSGNRRLSLFTTSWQMMEPWNLGLLNLMCGIRASSDLVRSFFRWRHRHKNSHTEAWKRPPRIITWRELSEFFTALV